MNDKFDHRTVSRSVQWKVTHRPRRMNIQMVQNILLIWLDNNIDENSADCRNTLSQLRRAVNMINTYRDVNQCIQFLQTIENEKACVIISGSLGQTVVPQIHDMIQIDCIFIFCGNKQYHEQWARKWPKIRGVLTQIVPICEALQKAAQQCERNATPISLMTTTGTGVLKKHQNQLEPSFMYTQILKEILLTIEFDQEHRNIFVQHCREALGENEDELKKVKKFKRNYHNESPIWWYTLQCFLYPMLNRALRAMDADTIIKMGFFIVDLHRDIEQLHQKQFAGYQPNKSFIVYRGQGMSTGDFEQMTKSEGGLMSFNNFLSTSRDPVVSLNFARDALENPDLVGILFVMAIDPAQSTTPFASIAHISHFKDKEDEVLFSMHTVFRIGEITDIEKNAPLYQVKLTLTSDNDKDLRLLTDEIRAEDDSNDKGWYRLGSMLLKMGLPDQAQEVYEVLLKQTNDYLEKGRIYDRLGTAVDDKGDYQEAISFYERSLAMYERTQPPPLLNLAATHGNIGTAHFSMGQYPQALSSYKKALVLQQQILPWNHPDLAATYNNIGLVYKNTGDYSKALSSHEKAFEIRQQVLSSTHPDLAMSYNNIALVYLCTGEYSKARSFCERAINIGEQSLPSTHRNLQNWKKNLEIIKKKL